MDLTGNILWVWGLTSPYTQALGAEWYGKAREVAAKVADIAQVDIACGVGVLSALSPRNRWERNCLDAVAVAHAFRYKLSYETVRVGTFRSNLERAVQILTTGNPQLNGPKTEAFAHNILYPNSTRVTVDVWAVRIAQMSMDLDVKAFDYPEYEAAYVRAAERVGILPKHLQAATWIEYRYRKGHVQRPNNQLSLQIQ